MSEAGAPSTDWLARGGLEFRRRPYRDPFDADAIAHEAGEEPPPDAPDEDPRRLLRFTASQGACTVSWGAPLYVQVELDRFADSRDELSAEVIVRSTVPGLERQLAQRRLPLLGPRAVTDLASYLAKRRSDPVVDWPELRRNPELIRIWLREGRLRGEKYGPTWVVTERELERFRRDEPERRRRKT